MMAIQNEEYVPIADTLLRSLTRDLTIFEAENHLFNSDYLAAMQSKTDEVRMKETGDIALIRQKQSTQELYEIGNNLNKPLKLVNLVFSKAKVETSLASDVLKKIRNRNFEGALLCLSSLQQIVSANSALLVANGMKEDFPVTLENIFNTMTLKSNEQTSLQQQRKAFTATNKNLYKELYVYISEVAKLGKIIFQGEQKATEYTLDHLLAFVHSSRGNKGGSLPKTNTQ